MIIDAKTTLEVVIQAAAINYKCALDTFKPWPTNSYAKNLVITERNLSFHFARAFAACIGGSVAFMEQQFSVPGKPRKLRLDVYAASPIIAVAMETKTFFDTTEAPGVLNDLDRVSCGSAQQQRQRHPTLLPGEVRGLVLVETWKDPVRSWWELGAASPHAQAFDPRCTATLDGYRRSGWTFSEIEIGTFSHPTGQVSSTPQVCWWLYAYSPPL